MSILRTLALGAMLLAAHAAGAAEPIKLIIPTTAGGGTDGFFRVLAKDAEPFLKTSIVIVNVGGAGGSIGLSQMLRSEPDGHTVAGVWMGPVTVAPHSTPVTYKPSDYIPVLQLTSAPYVLCTQPKFPADTGKAFIDELRKNPNKYTFGTDGAGGPAQLATLRVFGPLGISQRDVPYKGAGETLLALLGGHIDIYVGSIPPVLPYVQNGKAKCLMVTSADKVSRLPQAISLAELGLPKEETMLWRGILVPKGTPPDRVKYLETSFEAAANSPGTRKFVEDAGEEVVIIKGAALRTRIDDEYAALGKVAKSLNLRPQ
jgi:tripartite-type tricarboxylate transporter receptor subunit TctC